MTIDDLRTEMRKGFTKIDERFTKIDERFTKVDERFNGIYDEFEKLRAVMRADMKAEGEKTRRHFDVMVEKMHESVRIVAEATARARSPRGPTGRP